jgi:F-type H+-transporting ATPase subunit delta
VSNTKLQLIANSYAFALLESASEKKVAEDLYKAFKKCSPFLEDKQTKKTLDNPLLSADDHKALAKVFGLRGKAGDLVLGLIKTLSYYSRMALLPMVVKTYCDCHMEKDGVYEVSLITAGDLDKTQEAALKKKLETQLNRKISFNKKIQESLMAGFILEFNKKQIDLSLKGQLLQFSNDRTLK